MSTITRIKMLIIHSIFRLFLFPLKETPIMIIHSVARSWACGETYLICHDSISSMDLFLMRLVSLSNAVDYVVLISRSSDSVPSTRESTLWLPIFTQTLVFSVTAFSSLATKSETLCLDAMFGYFFVDPSRERPRYEKKLSPIRLSAQDQRLLSSWSVVVTRGLRQCAARPASRTLISGPRPASTCCGRRPRYGDYRLVNQSVMT